MKNNTTISQQSTKKLLGFLVLMLSFFLPSFSSFAQDVSIGDTSFGTDLKAAYIAAAEGDVIKISGTIDVTAPILFSDNITAEAVIFEGVTEGASINFADGVRFVGAEHTEHHKWTFKNLIINGGTHTGLVGGIMLNSGTAADIVTFEDCTLQGASTNKNGGALAFTAGGTIIARNTKFLNNTASDTGNGGVITLLGGSKGEFYNSVFTGNFSGNKGGVLYNSASELYVEGCLFTENRSEHSKGGGVLFAEGGGGKVTMLNSTLFNNSASGECSAIYQVNAIDAAVYTNLTIAYNTAEAAFKNATAAVRCTDKDGTTFNNCIIYGNTTSGTASDVSGSEGTLVNHSIVGALLVPALEGTGNILGDDITNLGMVNTLSSDNVLEITNGSQAIELGLASYLQTLSVTTDQTGNTRTFANDKVTAGAYEYVDKLASLVVNQPLESLSLKVNAANANIDLSNLFSDPETDQDPIVYSVSNNTNTDLVTTATVTDNTLTLSFDQTEMTGTAVVTIKGASAGREITFDLNIEVTDQTLEPLNAKAVINMIEGDEALVVDLSEWFHDTKTSSSDEIAVELVSATEEAVVTSAVANNTLTLTLGSGTGTSDVKIKAVKGEKELEYDFQVVVGSNLGVVLNKVNYGTDLNLAFQSANGGDVIQINGTVQVASSVIFAQNPDADKVYFEGVSGNDIIELADGARLVGVSVAGAHEWHFKNLTFKGGSSGDVGGIFIINSLDVDADLLTFENCKLEDAVTTNNGGAVGVLNGAKLETRSTQFNNNSGKNGGALFLNGAGEVKLLQTVFKGNTASIKGAAIQNVSTKPYIEGCLITENHSADTNKGAAVQSEGENGGMTMINTTVSHNTTTAKYGGIYQTNSIDAAKYINITVAYNTAETVNNTSSGMRIEDADGTVVQNAIIYGNTVAGVAADFSSVDGTEVYYSAIGKLLQSAADIEGNIVGDALTNLGLATTLSESGVLEIGRGSQVIDLGLASYLQAVSISTDQADNPRDFEGDKVTAGAYEYVHKLYELALNQPLENVLTQMNSANIMLDISQLFTDPEADQDPIVYSVSNNTNSTLVTGATIANNQLTLAFDQTLQSGEAVITIKGQSGEREITFDLNVVVTDQTLKILNAPLVVNMLEGDAPVTIDLSEWFYDLEGETSEGINITFTSNDDTELVTASVANSELSLTLGTGTGSANVAVQASKGDQTLNHSFEVVVANTEGIVLGKVNYGSDLRGAYLAAMDGDVIKVNGTVQVTESVLFAENATTGTVYFEGVSGNDVIQLADGVRLIANAVAGGHEWHFKNLTFEGGSSEEAGGIFNVNSLEVEADLISFENCKLTGATTTNNGGALSVTNGAKLMTVNTVFENNTGLVGGALFINSAGSIELKNSTFTGNTSSDKGGALHAFGTEVYVEGCLFAENRAENTAKGSGAINFEGEGGQMTMVNSTVFNNSTAGQIGGIYQSGVVSASTYTNITVANNVSEGENTNSAGMRVEGQAASRIYNSILYGNIKRIEGVETPADISGSNKVGILYSVVGSLLQNKADIEGNLIGDAVTNLGLSTTLSENNALEIAEGSQAVDLGLSTYLEALSVNTDQSGTVRNFNDGTVDAGAFEIFTFPYLEVSQAARDLVVPVGTTTEEIDMSALFLDPMVGDASSITLSISNNTNTELVTAATFEGKMLNLTFDENATDGVAVLTITGTAGERTITFDYNIFLTSDNMIVKGELADIDAYHNSAPIEVDLSGLFYHIPTLTDEEINFSVESIDNESIVSSSIEGATLTLTVSGALGQAEVTVEGEKDGDTASYSFNIMVETRPDVSIGDVSYGEDLKAAYMAAVDNDIIKISGKINLTEVINFSDNAVAMNVSFVGQTGVDTLMLADGVNFNGVNHTEQYSLAFDNLTFIGGTPSTLGGIINANGTAGDIITLTDCTLEGIESLSNGGAVYIGNAGQLMATNTRFINNTGNSGGAVYVDKASEAKFYQCEFTENKSIATGGALSVRLGSSVYVEGCLFNANVSDNTGNGAAAIYVNEQNSSMTVINSTFVNNTTAGKHIIFQAANTEVASDLVNVTIAYNHADNPEGYAVNLAGNRGVTVSNSIIYANTAGTGMSDLGGNPSVALNYSIVGTLVTSTITGESNIIGEFATNIGLAEELNEDGLLTLEETGKAIDLGIPAYLDAYSVSTDQRGLNRIINGGKIDAGAFELTAGIAPVLNEPIGNIVVKPNAESMTIDLSTLFTDEDSDNEGIVKAVVNNLNSVLVDASIDGDVLTLDFNQNDEIGESLITIEGESEGLYITYTFKVTVVDTEQKLVVINDLETVFVEENTTENIDLSGLFYYFPNESSEGITVTYLNSTNSSLVSGEVDGDMLNLTIGSGTGLSEIYLNARIDDASIIYTFKVNVGEPIGILSLNTEFIDFSMNIEDEEGVKLVLKDLFEVSGVENPNITFEINNTEPIALLVSLNAGTTELNISPRGTAFVDAEVTVSATYEDQTISETFTVSITSVLSVDNELIKETVKLYPMPFQGEQLSVLVPQGISEISWMVYNALGQQIEGKTNIKVNNQVADIVFKQTLSSGIYLMNLQVGDKVIQKKLQVR